MSTASLAMSGTETAGGGHLADRGLWLVGRGYDLAFVILSAALVAFPHASFAFYSVILSFLLIHHYFDHFIFLPRDRVITPRFDVA